MPYFFREAKGYIKPDQTMPINDSLVNKLRKVIKKKRFSFKRFDEFSYIKLMSNPNITYIDPVIVAEYEKLCLSYHNRINIEDKFKDNIPYLIKDIKSRMDECGFDRVEVADMLVKYLYNNNSEAKMLLWLCYGDILLNNIKRNINPMQTYCRKCGARFIPSSPNNKYCDSCSHSKNQATDMRIVVCKDCGKSFLVPKTVRNKTRCDDCQAIATKELAKLRKRKQREMCIN